MNQQPQTEEILDLKLRWEFSKMVLHLAQKWKVLYMYIYTLILLLHLTKTFINPATWKDNATYKDSQADTGSRYSME